MSCNITISVSDDFAREAKRLAKKYRSFKNDYAEFLKSIKESPLQGDEITKNIRKIRMAIGSKGKDIYVFDDVVTNSASYAIFANQLEMFGGNVLGGFFLGRTHYKYAK